jgi:hypothetical protein
MRPCQGFLYRCLLRANDGGYPLSVYHIGYAQLYVYALTVQYNMCINAHSHHDVALGYSILSPIESLALACRLTVSISMAYSMLLELMTEAKLANSFDM